MRFPSLSWVGRIHVVKMTSLPKVLNYFHTLPVHVSFSFFCAYCRTGSYTSSGHISAPECTIPLTALLWLPHKLLSPFLSPLMHHSLKLWDSDRYSGNLMSPFLLILPLFNNPLFSLGLDRLSSSPETWSLLWWSTHRFTEICHFLLSHTLPPWSSCQDTHWVSLLRHNLSYPCYKTLFEHLCPHSLVLSQWFTLH